MPKRPGSSDPVRTSPPFRALLKRVGRNVLRLRTEQGLTQEELAHRAGLVTRLYVRVEHAETNWGALTLFKIADALGVDVAELVARVRRRPPDDGRR